MRWILGPEIAAEANHFAESAGVLMGRSCQCGPLHRDIRANVMFPSCIREDGKTAQETALAFELEPASTAHRQIRLHGLS
jgi:hypothetical protein